MFYLGFFSEAKQEKLKKQATLIFQLAKNVWIAKEIVSPPNTLAYSSIVTIIVYYVYYHWGGGWMEYEKEASNTYYKKVGKCQLVDTKGGNNFSH